MDSAVTEVAQSVGHRLVEVMLDREKLRSHLSAIKRYVLLGQGDFVRTLLELAGPELDRPGKEISAYSLQGHVEAALRSCCTSGDDADLLKHVEVRLQRVMEGDRGWDVFGVAYTVDGPAGAVLGPETMAAYARASRLLWAITHVDHVLARTWHKLNAASHGLSTLRMLEKEHGVDIAAAHQVPALLRYLHARRAEMAQFVTGLQHHVVFEVLEPAWARLLKELPKAKGLDDIIALHEEALSEIGKARA